MPIATDRNWFQRICPHVWKIVSSDEIHDVLDPTVVIGVRSTRRCIICGSVTKTDVR